LILVLVQCAIFGPLKLHEMNTIFTTRYARPLEVWRFLISLATDVSTIRQIRPIAASGEPDLPRKHLLISWRTLQLKTQAMERWYAEETSTISIWKCQWKKTNASNV